jgi:hypothetical protein
MRAPREGSRAMFWADILPRSHGPWGYYAARRAASPVLDGSVHFTLGRNERRGAKLTGSRLALWAIIVLFRALPASPWVG